MKSRKSQKATASLTDKGTEEESLIEMEAKKVETSEQSVDGETQGSSEAAEVGLEETATGASEELEDSNASFFNDSSLGDYDFEEREQDVAVEKPVLQEDDTAKEGGNANEGEEERIIEGEEDDGAPSKDAILAKLRKGGATNVLANFPPPKESQERELEEDALDGGLPEKASGTLDLKASEYFTKYPKAIANPQVCGLCYCHSCDFISFPQERSLKLFNEDAEGLPEGWKVRAAVANISISSILSNSCKGATFEGSKR